MASVVQIVHAKKSEMGRGKGTYLLLVTISFQFQLPQISSLFQTSIFLVINVAGRVAWRYWFLGFFAPLSFIIFYIIHRPSLLSFPVLTSPSFSLPLRSLDRNQAAKLLCLLANVFCNMLNLSLSIFCLTIESYNWSLPIRYRPRGVLWVYGDSLALRFLESVQSRFLCSRLYVGCRRSYNWIYPVISEAVSKHEDDNLDFQPGKVIKTILSVLQRPEMQRKESVLLLNLGLHFPISVNFTTYQRLIGNLINTLKETKVNSQGRRVPRYKAKVIWKSSTAIHKENAEVKNKTNWRFFTTQVISK